MYLTIVEMAKAYDLNLYEWVMFVSYYLDQYRNYQFGIENGSEQWGDIKQLSKSQKRKRIPISVKILQYQIHCSQIGTC